MVRVAIVLVLASACSGKAKPATTTAGSGSGSQALYAKKISVSWGVSPGDGGQASVFLQTTDETGKQTSYPVGSYTGDCKPMKPAAELKAVSGIACTANAQVVELDATVSGEEIVVMKGSAAQGV